MEKMSTFAIIVLVTISSVESAKLTCASDMLRPYPYCNASLPISTRVDDLLGRMNLTEKIGQFGMIGNAIPRLGVSRYNYGGESLHGLWSTCIDGKCPTQFPAPVTMASSFNRELWSAVARAAAMEARAMYGANKRMYPDNDGFGDNCAKSLEGCLGLSFYAPNINIARDPRWGRIEETPGESPYLNGQYAAAFVRGFQGNGTYLTASSVVKHYVAYNLEVDLEKTSPSEWCDSPSNTNGKCTAPNDRHSFNAEVSDRDLALEYLPPFEAAVKSGASAVMCSYNAVNGEPMCTNKRLIAGTLRTDLKFDGVVATDCGALSDAHLRHRRYKTREDTVTAAIRSGVDSNCGSYFTEALESAMNESSANYTGLTEFELDVNVKRLLSLRFKLGLFDEDNPRAHVPDVDLDVVDSAEHQELALKIAQQGIVLLQNGDGVFTTKLPMRKGVGYETVAMIGPMANAYVCFCSTTRRSHSLYFLLTSDTSIARPPSLVIQEHEHVERISWTTSISYLTPRCNALGVGRRAGKVPRRRQCIRYGPELEHRGGRADIERLRCCCVGTRTLW